MKAIVMMSVLVSSYQVMAQKESRAPLKVATAIGDKLIAGTPFTQMYSTDKQQLPIEFDFNDGCKIWLNGMLIFENTSSGPVKISFLEIKSDAN